jgi:ribonuclease HI
MNKSFFNQFNPITKSIIKPPKITLIQTDGSFNYKKKLSRTACIIFSEYSKLTQVKSYYKHKCPMESEWSSVLDGIKFAKIKNVNSIYLENDNIGVIRSLVQKNSHIKFEEYYYQIINELNEFEYISVRWIPRKFNMADDLF